MTASLTRDPLGLLRLKAEARLREFSESCNVPAEDLWEIAMTAKDFPEIWEDLPGGYEFWAAFETLRASEIKELTAAR